MKKLFLLLAFSLLLSCGGKQESGSTETANNTETVQKEEEKKEEKKAGVLVEELPYKLEMRKPDGLGNVYIDMTFENKSEFPVVSLQIEALLKDVNEKTYFISTATVMPGETSPKFESFGPKSELESDFEPLKLSYSYMKNEKKFNVEYDIKLNKYYEYEVQE